MNRLLLPLGFASTLALAAAAPAFAQDSSAPWWAPTSTYGTLGYTGIDAGGGSDAHIGAVTGRIGERFGKYFGVEGELSGGVKNDTDQTTGLKTSLDHQYAGYVVGYLPVLPNADLFARVGYGDQKIREQGPGGFSYNTESLNYGAGGQYFFNAHDGVRAEYTRESNNDVGPNADTVSVSYVRKF